MSGYLALAVDFVVAAPERRAAAWRIGSRPARTRARLRQSRAQPWNNDAADAKEFNAWLVHRAR